jgi:hypothetical protein
MGGVNNRYGLVVAVPTLGLPLIPKSALPGSYFMGCGSQAAAFLHAKFPLIVATTSLE